MSEPYTNSTFNRLFKKKSHFQNDILYDSSLQPKHELPQILKGSKLSNEIAQIVNESSLQPSNEIVQILNEIKNDEVDKNTVENKMKDIRKFINLLKGRSEDFEYDIDFELDSEHIILLYDIYKKIYTDKEGIKQKKIRGTDKEYLKLIKEEYSIENDIKNFNLEKKYILDMTFTPSHTHLFAAYFIKYNIDEIANRISIEISFVVDNWPRRRKLEKYGIDLTVTFKYDKFLEYRENTDKNNSVRYLSKVAIDELLDNYKLHIGFFDPKNEKRDLLIDGYGKYDSKFNQIRFKKESLKEKEFLYKANIKIKFIIEFSFEGRIECFDTETPMEVNLYRCFNGEICWDWDQWSNMSIERRASERVSIPVPNMASFAPPRHPVLPTIIQQQQQQQQQSFPSSLPVSLPDWNGERKEGCKINDGNFKGIFYFNKSSKFEGSYKNGILNGILTKTIYDTEYNYILQNVSYPDLFEINDIIINLIDDKIIYLNEKTDNQQVSSQGQTLQNNISSSKQTLQKNVKRTKRSRFLSKGQRNNNKRKKQPITTSSSSVVKQEDKNQLKLLLDKFLSSPILENIDNIEFTKNLNAFINRCRKYDLNNNQNTILNNRRKLIFPIMEEMYENNIINNILYGIKEKQNIYIVDVSNLMYNIEVPDGKNKTTINAFIDNKLTENAMNNNTDIFIFVCQGEYEKDRLIEYEDYRYKNTKNIIISVSCLSNVNELLNNNLHRIKQIVNNIKNNKNSGIDCFTNDNFQQNPLDDFVILIILQCLVEFTTNIVNLSKYFKEIYPFHIKTIKIISGDNFSDWKLSKRISPYLIINSNSNYNYIPPIFSFNFLNKITAVTTMENINKLKSM